MDKKEMIPTFEVINQNISLTEINDTLNSFVYDKNGTCLGRLKDLFFCYDPATNKIIGERSI
jgi:hypothetical protein